MNDEKVKLITSFQQFFIVQLATTPALKSKVYHLRYRVYCDEFGYEPVELFPDQEETDEFDAHALHCLIMHRLSGLPAGCVRMVPSYVDGELLPLPLEKHCVGSLDQERVDQMNLDRKTVCEISRLAVDRVFRRRAGEELTRFGEVEGLEVTNQERRTFPSIAIAAFLAATAMTDLTGKTNIFAMMEPFLPRMMKRSGIIFEKVGSDMDFRGIRAPYFIQTESALTHMQEDLRNLYDWIYHQMKEQYHAAYQDR